MLYASWYFNTLANVYTLNLYILTWTFNFNRFDLYSLLGKVRSRHNNLYRWSITTQNANIEIIKLQWFHTINRQIKSRVGNFVKEGWFIYTGMKSDNWLFWRHLHFKEFLAWNHYFFLRFVLRIYLELIVKTNLDMMWMRIWNTDISKVFIRSTISSLYRSYFKMIWCYFN